MLVSTSRVFEYYLNTDERRVLGLSFIVAYADLWTHWFDERRRIQMFLLDRGLVLVFILG